MRTLTLALAALGCALALPGAASAAYSLGNHPDGILEGTSTACAGGCTIVQDWEANEQQRVPGWLGEHQVVVQWRVRGDGGQARLQRVTVGAGGAASASATTDSVQLTGVMQELPAALPVRAGDAIGLALTPGASVDSVDLGLGESTLTYAPALDDTPRGGVETEGAAIAFEAVLEPDADADGLGDETQDSCVNCVEINPTPTPSPTPVVPAPTPDPAPADPYAELRTGGPKATIAPTATKKGTKVSVTVSNPYAFAVSGKLQLKRGKKVVATAKLKLAANATRAVTLKVRKPGKSLTAAVTLRGPVGKQRTTTAKVKVSTSKPGKSGGGIDGTYRGTGAGADWVLVIAGGVVTNFNGSISTYCTKAGKQQNHSFAMIGDDPDPKVAASGAFAWEATSGYGFDKLKFDGVVSGTSITGKLMVESRPPINGADPVSGMPRIEFEYCFAGRDYTLTKG